MRSRSALKGAVASYLFFPSPDLESADAETVLTHFIPTVRKYLAEEKARNPPEYGVKFILKLKVLLRRYSDDLRKFITIDVWFVCRAQSILLVRDISGRIHSGIRQILGHYDNFVSAGSGWSLRRVVALELTYARFQILRAGCEEQLLPPCLANVRGIVSVRDVPPGECFHYSVAASILNPQRNPSRMRKGYKDLVRAFDFSVKKKGWKTLADVKRFERKFPLISINVYGFEKNTFPLYVTKKVKHFHVNLLMHEKHFYYVRNLGALVKTNNLKSRRRLAVCQFCLAYFSSGKQFSLHKSLCRSQAPTLQFPDPGSLVMKFKNFRNMLPAPFVIYCDLESLVLETEQINDKKLISVRKHQAISAGALTVCHVDYALSSTPFIYTGADCILRLLDFLMAEVQRIDSILSTRNQPMTLTDQDRESFEASQVCAMCQRKFTLFNFKVRDHDHISGKYRWALCNSCNLNHAKPKYEVNIFFHGLSNYDSHFLIQELDKIEATDIRIIPKTSEKFLSFSVDNVRFKDTYSFLDASLAVLVENLLTKGKEAFRILQHFIPCAEKRELFFQKGVFPYSYMKSVEVLTEKSLPAISAFTSDLTGQGITEGEYAFAQKVWHVFNCKTLQDYMEVYLLADVLLLADVYENFRTRCLGSYQLDPAHYFSTPHLTLDAFLKSSKMTLDLLSDVNAYRLFTHGLRGGLSLVCHRYSQANHPQIRETFDPASIPSYIYYLDANNLYGKCMTWPLPYSDFFWMERDFLQEEFIMRIPPEGEMGCILACDFEYPASLHDLHEDYPLAPEKRKIPVEELSPFAKEICEKFKMKSAAHTEKLMTTLLPKDFYVLHFWNFQLYVKLGLKVKKIHCGIRFRQKPFTRDYIEFNSNLRAKATNNFDSTLYKNLCNQLFGKFIEDEKKRTKHVLCTDKASFEKMVGSSCFKGAKIINKNLVGVTCGYPAVKVTKPFYVGMTILELAKFHMYSFHYNVMKPHFASGLKVLYTDTDSLMYEITTKADITQELKKLSDFFDFSNYSPQHPLYSSQNKKVPGLFKDEAGGEIITEFVGLRSKMYSFVFAHGAESKAAKGVKRNVIKNELHHADYKKCLFQSEQMEHAFRTISSKAHNVATNESRKVSLSPFDDKRYLIDAVNSLPYGHYKLASMAADV